MEWGGERHPSARWEAIFPMAISSYDTIKTGDKFTIAVDRWEEAVARILSPLSRSSPMV
jgi:hypothetical protein